MQSSRWNRWMKGLALVAVAALPVLFAGGCDSEDDDALLGPADAMAESESGGVAGPLATLTIDEIAGKVTMTSDQRDRLRDALDRAQAERRERASDRPRFGRRGAGRGRAGGAEEPPMIGFIEDASKILSGEQFLDLARLLAEKREAWGEEHPGFGPGAGGGRGFGGPGGREGAGEAGWGPFGDLAARHLDLTEDQRARVESITKEAQEAMRAIHADVASGSLTREQARDRIHAERSAMRDEIREVLTAEQWEKAQAFRRDRMGERIDARIDRMDEQLVRRAEFLGRVLDLSASQAEQVRAALLATIPERTEILEQVKSGALDPEDAFPRIRAIEEQLADRVASLLTPEQATLWSALKDLLPGRMLSPGR